MASKCKLNIIPTVGLPFDLLIHRLRPANSYTSLLCKGF